MISIDVSYTLGNLAGEMIFGIRGTDPYGGITVGLVRMFLGG
jgi:hypothetical protein